MAFHENEIEILRKCQLEWHCHEIIISQPEIDDGHEFKGYGIIKTHESGGLILDFICLKSKRKVDFRNPIPDDSLDEKQTLTMMAKSIDGCNIVSKGFRIDPTFFNMINPGPTLYHIGLDKIEMKESPSPHESAKNILHIEFHGECRIPANKMNETESTLGTSSASWNQTVLNYSGYEINIIRFDGYTKVSAVGLSLDLILLRNAIVFYIGFSTGKYIQPYYEYMKTEKVAQTNIRSVDKRKIDSRIPAPIHDLVHDKEGQRLDDKHYELFYKICEIIKDKPTVYESIYSQWTRVWHSFLSPEFSVSMLTISVAVEGLLNDIFIPAIKEKFHNEAFEKEKQDIIAALDGLDSINESHIRSIKDTVKKWGNLYPKKALNYLAENGVLEKYQITNWSDLRNLTAHPKLLEQDERRKRKDLNRTVVCLGLFYRLILNVFSYRGAHYSFEGLKEKNKLVLCKHINIL